MRSANDQACAFAVQLFCHLRTCGLHSTSVLLSVSGADIYNAEPRYCTRVLVPVPIINYWSVLTKSDYASDCTSHNRLRWHDRTSTAHTHIIRIPHLHIGVEATVAKQPGLSDNLAHEPPTNHVDNLKPHLAQLFLQNPNFFNKVLTLPTSPSFSLQFSTCLNGNTVFSDAATLAQDSSASRCTAVHAAPWVKPGLRTICQVAALSVPCAVQACAAITCSDPR